MNKIDTIAAISTPIGYGGIGIIRISGPMVTSIAFEIIGSLPIPRVAEYLSFLDNDGTILDKGIVLFFKNPNSFTGEDVLEFHGHGGPIVLDLLLKRITSFPDVRIANPGEFSERAFLNNKLDLIQAEAISDLINATSVKAAKSAVNSLQGMFSVYINELVELIIDLRSYIETIIDFSDEMVDFISDKNKIEFSMNNIINKLNKVQIEARQNNILREGKKIVIIGHPNSGKSSLMNALSRREVSIVSSIKGTTRDVLREYVNFNGIPICIIDTAGLHNSNNEIEKIGIKKAWDEIKQSDHILLVIDSTTTSLINQNIIYLDLYSRISSNIPITVIRNKADITCEKIGIKKVNDYTYITLSVQSSFDIDILRNYLEKLIIISNDIEGKFLARRRHINALEVASFHLLKGKKYLNNNFIYELFAEELRLAQKSLNEITGEFSSDDLLERIFSNFCIGK